MGAGPGNGVAVSGFGRNGNEKEWVWTGEWEWTPLAKEEEEETKNVVKVGRLEWYFQKGVVIFGTVWRVADVVAGRVEFRRGVEFLMSDRASPVALFYF